MTKNEAKSNKSSLDKYDPSLIEPFWQSKWEKSGVYQTNLDTAKKPFYNLMMFPYPSAEGLHVGSVFAFAGADIYGRFKKMQGFDVFEPIGLDGFGIHSENHAIKTGTHPVDHAARTEKNFYRQLHSIGNGFDWRSKLETYDPNYYKWTQWLFIQLFKAGLAYRKKSPVNFCPSCMTVLADEQVIEDKCERCGSIVEKRDLEQWFFRITKYAEKLDRNIAGLNWSDRVKTAQKNWIGKSEGVKMKFPVIATPQCGGSNPLNKEIEVYTTAIDTVYGVSFMVISPEHPLIKEILKQVQDDALKKSILDYIDKAKSKSEIERQAEGKEKTGVFSGLHAINPLNGHKVPVWIADYVLMGYGTGAVMGVPGHDARDHEFARKFKLEIIPVIRPKKDSQGAEVGDDGFWNYSDVKTTFKDKSELFNSGQLDGLSSYEAKKKLERILEEKGFGRRETTYRLRDWLISRQRYWGPPIPMIHCEKCGWQPVPEDQLPVKLPYIKEFKPMGTGKSPLANYPDFYETVCPECSGKARRETDVSDTFLDSSWYFLRYLAVDWQDIAFPSEKFIENPKSEIRNPKQIQNNNNLNSKQFSISNLEFRISTGRKKFLPVAMYIGGAEHSVLHLLYSRFITMALCDLGYLDFEEPFSRFYAHGLIIKDGAKMSKSKGNVINPDEYIRKYGADTLRLYLHFLGPLSQDGDFRQTGLEGMHKFLKRIYILFKKTQNSNLKVQNLAEENLRIMHETIKGVTDDLENLRYNTAIAKLMTWYNSLVRKEGLSAEEIRVYLKLLAPFAPHLTEELFQQFFGGSEFKSIHSQSWPEYDPKFLAEDSVAIAVQVNGKMRDMIRIQSSLLKDQKEAERLAGDSDKIKNNLQGKKIIKVIYVPGKILNFVIE